MNPIRALRPMIGGTWTWDVRPVTALPPGAWLKRNGPSGTPLDWMAPEFVHPLELLSVHAGRFGDETSRVTFMQLHDARQKLRSAFVCWSQALGLPIREVAKWYWVFTPVRTGDVAVLTLARWRQEQGEAWAALGLPDPAPILAQLTGPLPAAADRPTYRTVDARKG